MYGTVTSNYFYTFYRAYMISKKLPYLQDRELVKKVHSEVWKTVLDHYINNEGGVYLDNLGYLCHMITPVQKFTFNKKSKRVTREETNGYYYRHICMGVRKNRSNYHHLIFSPILIKKLRELMRKGKRYRFLYREVQAKTYRKRGWKIKHLFDDKSLKYYKRENKK